MVRQNNKPDLLSYHKSIGKELDTVKNRLRNLVKHWQTDGEWKESALRTVLKNHLPNTSSVGRGFVISREEASTQIDLMVLKEGKPTLFKDSDLYIVTPDVPAVIVEVKTKLAGYKNWHEALLKLGEAAKICYEVSGNQPWLGLFVYQGTQNQAQHILNAVCEVYRETGIKINCVSCGNDIFMRFWPIGRSEEIEGYEDDANREYWRIYKLEDFAKSYFISNLVDSICDVDRVVTDYSWFAIRGGKGPNIIQDGERRVDDCANQN